MCEGFDVDFMKNMIHQYVKGKHGILKGVVCAIKIDKGDIGNEKPIVKIGWSKINKKDKIFNKAFGLEIAKSRAITNSRVPLPHSLRAVYEQIKARAIRYYKDAKLQENINEHNNP